MGDTAESADKHDVKTASGKQACKDAGCWRHFRICKEFGGTMEDHRLRPRRICNYGYLTKNPTSKDAENQLTSTVDCSRCKTVLNKNEAGEHITSGEVAAWSCECGCCDI